jgi:circadian clock protein KaiC
MEKVKTGIPGFDDMMQGGFIPLSSNLLSGEPGTGKTIFCMHYIYNGATQFNQRGLFISFEQREQDIIEQAKSFGCDLEPLIRSGKVGVYSIPVNILDEEIVGMVLRLIESFKPERLVIDSISTFSIAAPMYVAMAKANVSNATKFFMYKFVMDIKKQNCTTLLTSELNQNEWLSKDSIAEFVVDSVVVLRYFGAMGESSRTISIKKARQTKFDEYIHSFAFTPQGLNIHKSEKFEFSGK